MAERSVSKAAGRLRLSQPALSHALARLRDAMGDELFVRVPRGMAPTPRALALAPAVGAALERAKAAFASPGRFLPAAATGQLTLATTEYFEHLALPRLIPELARQAPGIVLRSSSTAGRLPKEAMERGECDLAVAGFFGDLPQGFHRQKLFDDDFVCVLRRDHPQAAAPLTLETYLALGHLLVSPQGDLSGVVDRQLAKLKRQRRVVAGIANFLTPGWVVASSDLILTIPRRLSVMYERHLPVVVLELPLTVPGITLFQVWHERTDGEPMYQWLRKLVRAAAVAPPPSAATA